MGIRTVITIQKKEWKSYHLERLEKAKIKPSLLLICVLDRDEACFAELKESGIEYLTTIYSKKQREEDNLDGYRNEILKYLEGKQEKFNAIIIAGPGFEKENLLKHIKERNPELAKKIFIEHCHSLGITGINEVVRKCSARILRDSRIAKETELVEELFSRIYSEGLAVYGKKETEHAVKLGAVETLLVSEEKIPEFEKIMDLTEKMGGRVKIISSDHEAGERFLHLGGIAGFLRFRV